jgi:5-methylcytosine-specific restriction endonuclease McrBC regulatory subunit McrC
MAQFNAYQTFAYTVKYGNTKPRVKHLFWAVYYGTNQITTPLSYAICVNKLKEYKTMGVQFPDKNKFAIKPAY